MAHIGSKMTYNIVFKSKFYNFPIIQKINEWKKKKKTENIYIIGSIDANNMGNEKLYIFYDMCQHESIILFY